MTAGARPTVEFEATLITRGGGIGAKRIMEQHLERGNFINSFTRWERVEPGTLTLDNSEPLPLSVLQEVKPLAIEPDDLLHDLSTNDARTAAKRGAPSYYGGVACANGRSRLVVLSQQPRPAVERRLEIIADVRLREEFQVRDGDNVRVCIFNRLDWLRRRLTPKPWFEKWRDPREFFLAADRSMELFKPDEILGLAGVQHLYDAFISGLFARIWNEHSPCDVRLLEDKFPDAQLQHKGGTLDLEITMADRKDRRMAVEHRKLRAMREDGELFTLPFDWDEHRQYALEAVRRVCGEKARKYLGSSDSDRQVQVHLLVYVNFPTFASPVLSNKEMVQITEPWRHNFQSIWLLRGARLFRAWPTPHELTATTDPTN